MEYPSWFGHYAIRFFAHHLRPLAGKPGLRFLQVGVFTGDASLWLLDNILTGDGSCLVDVDTWKGSDEPDHKVFDWEDVETVYRARVAEYQNHIIYKCPSRDYFRAADGAGFDFIYIDGDHTAPAVLSDAVLAFEMLKPGGLIAFDDYLWKSGRGRLHDPRAAIDAFADIYSERLARLENPQMPGEQPLQVWLRRLS